MWGKKWRQFNLSSTTEIDKTLPQCLYQLQYALQNKCSQWPAGSFHVYYTHVPLTYFKHLIIRARIDMSHIFTKSCSVVTHLVDPL
jgi:hypothetical protein